MLQPNVVVLLDVGTKPGNKSLYHLWKTFDLNSNVGGAVSIQLARRPMVEQADYVYQSAERSVR